MIMKPRLHQKIKDVIVQESLLIRGAEQRNVTGKIAKYCKSRRRGGIPMTINIDYEAEKN